MSKDGIFNGFFWKFCERISAQVVSFIVSLILARLLMPHEYGIVSLILIFINITNVFIVSGLSVSLVQKKDADEVDFSTVFYCSLVLSIFLYIVLYISAPYISLFFHFDELTFLLRLFSIKIIVSSYNSIQHSYVSRHMIFKKFFYSTLIGTIFSGVIGIILAFKGFGASALVAQYLANSIIDSIVLTFIIPWKPKLLFSIDSAKRMISYGWKVLATDLLGVVFDNVRSIVIGKFYKPADLAFYSRGQQFPSLVCNNIDVSLSTVIFPAIANQSDDLLKVKLLLRKSLSCASYIVFPMMSILASVSDALIIILLTDKWIESVIFLKLYSVVQALNTVSKINLHSIKAIGRSDITLRLELLKKPIYLFLLILTVNYGVMAIAISMAIYSFIGTFINMMPNIWLLNYSIKEQLYDLLPSFYVSILLYIISTIISFLNYNLYTIFFLQIITTISVYIVYSVITKQYLFVYIIDKIRKR